VSIARAVLALESLSMPDGVLALVEWAFARAAETAGEL